MKNTKTITWTENQKTEHWLEVVPIDNKRELPDCDLWFYAIIGSETMQDTIDAYVRKHKRNPAKAWMKGERLVWFELPE